MAKVPRAGEVKTRLCPPLELDEAARLYRAFLLDKVEQVRSLGDASHAIAYTPDEGRSLFAAMAPDFILVPQRGGELGVRLAAAAGELLAQGHAAVLLIDTDTPTLPTGCLVEALALVARADTDLVLGPSEDGGYYLIGLRAAPRELFEGVPWSTPQVFAETVRRALRHLSHGVRARVRWILFSNFIFDGAKPLC